MRDRRRGPISLPRSRPPEYCFLGRRWEKAVRNGRFFPDLGVVFPPFRTISRHFPPFPTSIFFMRPSGAWNQGGEMECRSFGVLGERSRKSRRAGKRRWQTNVFTGCRTVFAG